jgi:glycosyltransferase involved in cell wall biosynthesis
MKTLSIIIPFLNEEKTLNQILDKIINLDLGLKKEIILVNDGSTDKSEEIYKDTINHASK